MRVVVLGASGFIGGHLTAALSAAGMHPVAASRRPVAGGAVETAAVDVLDGERLAAVLSGADAVINCVCADARTIRDGAAILVEACARAGMPRLVHFSSMAIYGAAVGILDEEEPLDRGAGWYGAAKCEAEDAMRRYADLGGVVLILRPGCVYGPGGEHWVGRIGRLLRVRRIGDLGAAGDGRANLVDVRDVAAAAVRCLQASAVLQPVYNLAAPGAPTWNRYFALLAKAIGATPLKRIRRFQLQVDAWGLSVGLKLLEPASRRMMHGASHLPDPLPPSLLALWRQDIELDARRAGADLVHRWTPLEEGLFAAADWFIRTYGPGAAKA